MKVGDNSTKLFFLLSGSGISDYTQIFINSDNNSSTGYTPSDWSTSGADFMIENDEL